MSFHAGQSFTFGETPSATKWNYLWENDYALADGTGISDDAIDSRHILDGAVDANHLVSDAIGHGFLEIARTTLGSAGATISVTSIPARKYLQVLFSVVGSGGTITTVQARLNNDSGNNYSRRTSSDGGADATGTSSPVFMNTTGPAAADICYGTLDIVNIAANEKLGSGHCIVEGTTGAGTAPTRQEIATKWVNVANQISRFDLLAAANSFAIGGEVVITGKN